MKPYELIDGGLYKVGDKVVKYSSTLHCLKIGNHYYAFIGGAIDVLALIPKTQTIIPLEPLPLTTEMLEKWGFKLIEDYTIKKADGFLPDGIWQNDKYACGIDNSRDRFEFYTFSYDPEDDRLFNQIINVCYAHQLQQALHLCGRHDLANNLTWEE